MNRLQRRQGKPHWLDRRRKQLMLGEEEVSPLVIGTAADVTFVPSGNVSAVNVQSAIMELDAEKVAKAGDTMSGMLTLPATTPSTNQHATSKLYVDTTVAAGDAARVAKTGDTMSGALGLPLVTNSAFNQLNFGTAGTGINGTANSVVFSTGGTQRFFIDLSSAQFSVPVTLPNDPTLNLHAATKQYVDTHVGSGSGAAVASVGDSPPVSPVAGQLWWESFTGNMYVFYNDGTSSQWVPAIGTFAFPFPVIAISNASILEGSPIGTLVGVLSVTNAYTGVPTFILIDDADGEFTLVGNEIRSATVMDYEEDEVYYIEVGVSGITPAASPETFEITVINVVEPVILFSGMSIDEDAAIGDTVGVLSIGNVYTGTPVYSLTDSAGGRFSVVGTSVKVASGLDYETADTHNITVHVTGITPAAVDKVFTIVVNDVEEAEEIIITWDTTIAIGAAPIYSNGNLTATGSGTGGWTNAIASYGAATGKYYCEFKFTDAGGIPDWHIIGIRRLENDGSNLGSDMGSIGWGGGGTVLRDNGTSVAPGTIIFVQNDTIAMAVDLDVGKIWFKNITTNSLWNGIVGEPGVGGGSIATPAFGPTFYPSCTVGYSSTYACVANFGATPYVGTPPTGFLDWNSIPNSMTWDRSDLGVGSATYSNANLTVTGISVASMWNTVFGSTARKIIRFGKYYWEVRLDAATTINNILFGILNIGYTANTGLGFGGTSFGWNAGTGTVHQGSTAIHLASVPVAVGHWAAIAIDMDNKKLYVKNITAGGTWNGVGGNPVAGTGYMDITSLMGATDSITPAVQVGYSEAGSAVTANFGATEYQAVPPAGFRNWGDDVVSAAASGVTVDIVDDYGAVADAEWAYATLTISTNVLVAASSTWPGVAGDYIGKDIIVGECGQYGPQGGAPLMTTITGWTSPTQITLAHNAGFPITALPNVVVAWGTNNIDAFTAFRTDFQDEVVTLNIPTGSYLFGFIDLLDGIRKITINGNGSTLCGYFRFVATAQYEATGHTGWTEPATIGSTYVDLKTPSDASKFVVGDYGMMSGFDMQMYGYPTNQALFEFLRIVAVDGDDDSPTYGRVTFETPLVQSYLDTWPIYTDEGPSTMRYGGPAMLSAMDPHFNLVAEINDLEVAMHGQAAVGAGSLTFNNCTFHSHYGPYPGIAYSVVFNNCVGANCRMEIDKLVYQFEMNDCTWEHLGFQSASSNRVVILDNTTLTDGIVGSAEKMVIQNGCDIAYWQIGSVFFGYPKEVEVSNSVIHNLTGHGAEIRSIEGGTTGGSGDGIQLDSSMVGGVIPVPPSKRMLGVSSWAITGGQLFLSDQQVGSIGKLTITDVKDSPTVPGGIDIHTDWPPGTYPARTYGTLGLWLIMQPAPICTFNNVTGCADVEDLSQAPDGDPIYTYSKRTYNGSTINQYPNTNIQGKLRKIVINVTKVYSGTRPTFYHSYFPGWAIDFGTGLNHVEIVTVIDLKQLGNRTLDLTADTYPKGWTYNGSSTLHSGDTLTTVTGPKWIGGNNFVNNAYGDISGESSSVWPSFTVEIITDQGW